MSVICKGKEKKEGKMSRIMTQAGTQQNGNIHAITFNHQSRGGLSILFLEDPNNPTSETATQLIFDNGAVVLFIESMSYAPADVATRRCLLTLEIEHPDLVADDEIVKIELDEEDRAAIMTAINLSPQLKRLL